MEWIEKKCGKDVILNNKEAFAPFYPCHNTERGIKGSVELIPTSPQAIAEKFPLTYLNNCGKFYK
jgi:hypothetical protein